MLELRHILCPIDFSDFSVRAYRHALSVAQHYRAELFVLNVVELWQYPWAGFTPGKYYDETCQHLLRKSEEKLQELVGTFTDHEIQPQLVVQQGTAADRILEFAGARRTDLIVMGTHGRRGFDRLVLGSVTERVMRKSSCPVVTIRTPEQDFDRSGTRQDPVQMSRILFCTDFSENAQRAMFYAISLTAEYNAELTLLHVLEDFPDLANREPAIAAATARLERLIPTEVLNATGVKTVVRVGAPYREIIHQAMEAQTDLAVMAVRGRSVQDDAVFGATTYRVIQLGPCRVLAVHV
jgi:nucleotide-binding universal stress UspA family protein